MDLWALEQPAFDRAGNRVGIFRSAIRSSRGVPDLEDTSVREKDIGGWKAGALRREVAAVRRLVCDAAHLCRRRFDHRRFRKFSGFAEAERYSLGDEERNAGGGDNF